MSIFEIVIKVDGKETYTYKGEAMEAYSKLIQDTIKFWTEKSIKDCGCSC